VSAELVAESNEPTERILRAAISCYTQYGVSRTTAGEVARVAGVSRGTIYRYFPGPRALETAAMNLMAHDVALRVDAAADPSQTFEQFVATLFEVLADHLVSIRARQHLLEERETIPWTMYQSNEDVTRRFIGRLLRDRLASARLRGEIDPLITDADAVESVWIAVRAITSLQSSPVVDLDDPGDVGRWFARFVFRGLSHRPA
jgi:AcrR family transcriptional regulator